VGLLREGERGLGLGCMVYQIVTVGGWGEGTAEQERDGEVIYQIELLREIVCINMYEWLGCFMGICSAPPYVPRSTAQSTTVFTYVNDILKRFC
jgi:hypothetical protein